MKRSLQRETYDFGIVEENEDKNANLAMDRERTCGEVQRRRSLPSGVPDTISHAVQELVLQLRGRTRCRRFACVVACGYTGPPRIECDFMFFTRRVHVVHP